jgi:predicted nucleic acid-binding protein
LERSAVAIHPFVIGEIACGSLRDREAILELLQDLPAVVVAGDAEVLHFIERHAVHGKGIGYVDVHLLALAVLTGVPLWTRDLKLRRVAVSLGVAHPEPRR